MKKIGAIEVRVSTDMQTEYSPDSQIKICLDYAQKHDIYVPPENIYRDDGISGRSAVKRSEFMRMIADAQKEPRPFDVILIYSFSRFARNKYEAVMYKHLLRSELGIEVISVTQPLPDSPDKVLLESLYEGMDEHYSLNLAKECIRGKREKAERGEHMGHAPFGYWNDKNIKQLVVKEDEKDIVKMIFEEYAKPDTSFLSVCRKLEDMGILTKAGKKHWHEGTLLYILQNPVYVGQTRLCLGGYKKHLKKQGETIIREGKHTPIIEQELWDKVQEKVKSHIEVYAKRTKANVRNDYWLRGLVKCSNCGSNLVLVVRKNSHKKPYFQCNGYNKKRCDVSHQMKASVIEEAVLEEIKKTFTEKLDVEVVYKEESMDEVRIIEGYIEKNKKKLERVKIAYENEVDTLEEYKEKKERLTAELERLEGELKKAQESNTLLKQKERVYSFCKTAYKTLSSPRTDLSIKYKIAHELIEKIVYDKPKETLFITYRA